MSATTVRLFQRCAYGWLALYMAAMLGLGDAMWVNAPVQLFTSASGLQSAVQASLDALSPVHCMLLCAVVLLTSLVLLKRHRWWLALLVWVLFRIIGHRAWLASNGGVQLMENMLLWAALMGVPNLTISTAAFWLGRLQLLLVYAVAAAHKFTGVHWLDGTAVSIVANDPAFHLHWLATSPVICTVLTYCALAFIALFPLAVWWTPSRRIFLALGVVFHLSTALFMDIPQMGLVFIACYSIWLSAEDRAALSSRFGFARAIPA